MFSRVAKLFLLFPANHGSGQGVAVPEPPRPQDHLRRPAARPWAEYNEAARALRQIHSDRNIRPRRSEEKLNEVGSGVSRSNNDVLIPGHKIFSRSFFSSTFATVALLK